MKKPRGQIWQFVIDFFSLPYEFYTGYPQNYLPNTKGALFSISTFSFPMLPILPSPEFVRYMIVLVDNLSRDKGKEREKYCSFIRRPKLGQTVRAIPRQKKTKPPQVKQ
jgi:hypothetical protein